KAVLAKGELVPLTELLSAGPRQFVVSHAREQEVSDRYYLASWALAYYLAFERKKLGTAELERYVEALKRNDNPIEAFQQWVSQPLEPFERGFNHYLLP